MGSWRLAASAPVGGGWSVATTGADAHAGWGSPPAVERVFSARTTLMRNPAVCLRVKREGVLRATPVSVTSPALRHARWCQAPTARQPRVPRARDVWCSAIRTVPNRLARNACRTVRANILPARKDSPASRGAAARLVRHRDPIPVVPRSNVSRRTRRNPASARWPGRQSLAGNRITAGLWAGR